MAGQILNRRELRKQADQVEQPGAVAPDAAPAEVPPEKQAKATKAPAAPKANKPRKPKPPPRLRARWGVFDGSMKQVAVFDYKDRAAAEAKVADLLATRKTGTFFLQMVKEPMPEDAAPAPAAR